jgi:rod shape determining protein RodA
VSTTPILDPPSQAKSAAPARSATGLLPFDPLLLLGTIGLAICSMVVISGATRGDIPGDPNYYVTRQGVYFGVGFVAMIVLSRVDYSHLRALKWQLYGLLMATILAVLALGVTAKGATRAIQLPFFSFQGSELGKVLLILALSAFLVDRVRNLGHRDTTARVLLLTLIPAFFVIAQPDLGSGMVYVVIALAVLFMAGTSWKHFAALLTLGAVAITMVLVVAPHAGVQVLKPYQVDRLTAFLNPTDNPQKQGYQQLQSKIAIGAGQKKGRGEKGATQTRFDFLPEHHTDFVFAVVGERFGFVGAAFVLSLYALLIWRALRILTISKNLFGTLIAGGIVGMLLFQVFVNVGMTLGIMPITGITLPLMSYGGSSVLTTLLALGLLQSIYAQGRAATARKSLGPRL